MFSAGNLAKRQDLFADIATWDLNPLRDSRQPLLARHPPRTLRDSFAACLLTPLLHLAQDPDSPAGWRLLMVLPRILLRTSSAKRPDWLKVGARLIQFRHGLWRNLYDEAADAVSQPPQPRHAPNTTGILARAEGLAKRGNLAKSLQSLTATPVPPPSTDVLQALSARHPPACQAIPDWVREFTTDTSPSIHPRDFRRILAKCPNGVGAGPSGTTFEHLRDAALGNTDIFLELHALTNTALAGKLSSEAGELPTASRLLAFAKPHGGTRPIAVGECLLRLVAEAALFLVAVKACEHFAPLQFGVAIPRGIKAAVHTARTYLEENKGAVALQIDLANAFNAVERAAVFEGLKGTTMEFMVPLVRLSYGAPSALLLDHAFHTPPLLSARGVRQGDPLGPLLFAASIHPCLVAVAEAHPQVVILAYADVIMLLGEAAACTWAFTHLTSALLSLGLEHNPEKYAAWSAAHIDLASLPQHVPFSADGIRVLGSPIGPQPGCAAMVQERLSAAAEPLQLLSQMDPQLCLLLLTRCVSCRASYLVRTTPLDVLLEETWSAWGEQLLHTYLSAAHTAIPREEAERVRIWRQAALPVTLGGLGITNPATEGAFAYLASVISSAHLLHSFGDTVHPAIALMLPLMDAAADSPSVLPRHLAAAEAELPPDGLEALQVGRRDPEGPKLQQALSLAVHTARYIELLDASREMPLNPLFGHTQRLQSLLGPGAGDWLLAIPLIPALRLGPSQHSTASSFRLGLPLPVPRRCDCRYRTTFSDHRLPNHLMRCEKGGGRIATHHALRDECAKIAAKGGYTAHKESTVYSPVKNLKADVCIRHPDTGEVHMCDITVTDPVSHQDELARKATGLAARMQAAKKEDKYARPNAWVGFHAMAVETYGYPSPGLHAFLRSCAKLAGKRRFNGAPKSREVARLLTEYRQRWSVTLQRAQANAIRDKTHEAIAADELGLQGPFGSLGEEQLYQLLEDPTGQ